MAKNPVLPLYYNDLVGATKTWTDEEFGAYMRLLIEQWDKGFIPSEMNRLVKIADSVEKNWPVLSKKFTPGEDFFLRNSVMEEIREKRKRFSEHQTENVRKRYQTSTKHVTKTLPLEIEIEIEKEIEKELEKEIVLPFTSENFRVLWQGWKKYRLREFKKSYKSIQSEQQALSHLHKISGGNEQTAKEVIEQSEANQWQGLFELKKSQNGSISKQQSQRSAVETAIRIGENEFAALRKKHTEG